MRRLPKSKASTVPDNELFAVTDKDSLTPIAVNTAPRQAVNWTTSVFVALQQREKYFAHIYHD